MAGFRGLGGFLRMAAKPVPNLSNVPSFFALAAYFGLPQAVPLDGDEAVAARLADADPLGVPAVDVGWSPVGVGSADRGLPFG